jgi:4-amino-4-deoxy-L-arabinose transferase-like glycosyltransferase
MTPGNDVPPRAGADAAAATRIWRRPFSWQVALIAILLLGVLVRMPFLHVPLITDEGGYAYTTHYGLSGKTLYRILWFDRTQGILWVYRVIFDTLGRSVVAIRLFAALYNAGSALIVYGIGRRLGGKRTGLLAAFFFGIFSVMPHVQGFTANAELFMTLPALASLALLLPVERMQLHADAPLFARHNSAIARRILLSGVCAGIAVIIKPAEVAAIIVAALLLLGTVRRQRAAWRKGARPLIVFGVGASIGVLPAALDGFARDGRAYLRQVLLYRGTSESIISVHAIGRLGHSLWNSLVVGGDMLPLVILTLLALTVYRRTLPPDATRLAPIWFGASLFGIALGGNWFTHYFFQLLPPLAIYAALAVRAAVLEGAARRWRQRFITVVSLSVMLTAAYAGHYFVAQPAQISWDLYHDRAYQAQGPLVAYIKANTHPSDRIYVAFEGPELYYLSERQSIFPVVWRQPVLTDPETFDRLLATLDTPAGPEYIIDLDAPRFQHAHERLRPILERRYELVAIIQGVQVYHRIPSTWNMPWTERVDR